MRHIILDTETTGLSAAEGHRIIEIGAVEMVNYTLTGKHLHLYINPMREIDEGAVAIHGITSDFLSDKPVFADIASAFLDFIADDVMVIHNAPFDIGFLNAELSLLAKTPLSMDRVVDTLQVARFKFPGAQASLDALCRRFAIDNTHRDLHGALIDAHLLADVFVELEGGKQPGFDLELEPASSSAQTDIDNDQDTALDGFIIENRPVRAAREHVLAENEIQAHDTMLSLLSDPIWKKAETSSTEGES